MTLASLASEWYMLGFVAYRLTPAIAGTNTYLGNQAPHYPLGFGLGMGVTAMSIVVAITLVFLLKRENKKLDEQMETYGHLLNPDLPPDFRYVL
jgi:hypothetical protein